MSIANQEPLISIVIPTYNHASFLKEAMTSVVNQTYTNWEAIIVNNYSDDDTVDVVNSFNDSRFKLINFHNNGIIAAARNKAISESKGGWLAFLDSDDIWYPKKLELCMQALIASNADAICHGEKWNWENGSSRDVKYGPESRSTYDSLLFNGNCISTSATICRRQSVTDVGGFSEDLDLVTAEDYELWLKLARSNNKFIFKSEVLGEYRIHPGGSSQAIKKNVSAILMVIHNHIKSRTDIGFLKSILYRRAKALVLLGGARGMQSQHVFGEAFGLLLKSLYEFPFILRTYLALAFNLLPIRLPKSD